MSAATLVRGERPNNFTTTVPGGYVSTCLRESSARVEYPLWYFETMAFIEDAKGIAWESAANYAAEADRQHALAVRWFSRRGTTQPTLSAPDSKPVSGAIPRGGETQ